MPKPSLRTALAALLAVAAWPAWAGELPVTFVVAGRKVAATLSLPERGRNPPVVLLLPEFAGNRDERRGGAVKEGVYARAAQRWAERGIASLRIDYRYNGDSDGQFADGSLDAYVIDGVQALEYLAGTGKVDPQRMAVVGWGMGGAVATGVAARSRYPLDGLALWNPDVDVGAAFIQRFGRDKIRQGLAGAEAPTTIDLAVGRTIALKQPFFVSLFTLSPPAEIARYGGPLMVAVGTRDEIGAPQPAQAESLIRYHGGEGELLVLPMDRMFNLSKSQRQVDALIEATESFLLNHFR
ncbi:lysophospholipase [Lysobacter sp. BMK333-48F3]|uniref:alpha/beta hydrolase family protein n=1 Tax=Lysobacter sp. BMK333-48F3 TaxID=2867962 RepID=UPI001C8C122B|nr:alpha/beta hydrolase [Lysobacter sp. BMK333-48F3]MBX9402290.1 lysophospholipase [Lysobacter sp. BMK333-48F3]